MCVNDSMCGPCSGAFTSANDFVPSFFHACQTYAPIIVAFNAIALAASVLGIGALVALLAPCRRERKSPAMSRVDASFFFSLALFQVASTICAAVRVSDVTRAVGVDVLETISFLIMAISCTTAFALFLARVKGVIARFVGPSDVKSSSNIFFLVYFVLHVPLSLSLILSLVTGESYKSTWAIVLAVSASLISTTYMIQIHAVVKQLHQPGYRSRSNTSPKLPVFGLVVTSVYVISFAIVVVDIVIACTPQLMSALYGIANSLFMASLALFWLVYLLGVEWVQKKRKHKDMNVQTGGSTGRSTDRVFVGALLYMSTNTWVGHDDKLSTVQEEDEGASEVRSHSKEESIHGYEQQLSHV